MNIWIECPYCKMDQEGVRAYFSHIKHDHPNEAIRNAKAEERLLKVFLWTLIVVLSFVLLVQLAR